MSYQNEARYFSHHKIAATQFKPESTQDKQATLCVEMTKTGENGGVWDKKISFQLKHQSELVQVALFMIGRISECNFKNHGKEKNKSLHLKRNDNQDIFISLSQGDIKYHDVLGYESAWLISVLATNQLRNRLSMTFEEAMQMLRLIHVPNKP